MEPFESTGNAAEREAMEEAGVGGVLGDLVGVFEVSGRSLGDLSGLFMISGRILGDLRACL